MVTPARFDCSILAVIAIVHLAAQASHAYGHIAADVPNTALQQVFIVVVVTLGPLVAVLVAWRRNLRLGGGLFAASMVAAFLFGYLLHFVIDSPDLHSNVIGEHAGVFFHSALSLALIEVVGFAYGLSDALRKPGSGCAG